MEKLVANLEIYGLILIIFAPVGYIEAALLGWKGTTLNGPVPIQAALSLRASLTSKRSTEKHDKARQGQMRNVYEEWPGRTANSKTFQEVLEALAREKQRR